MTNPSKDDYHCRQYEHDDRRTKSSLSQHQRKNTATIQPNSLAEYQGYSRPSRHFTYSSPPPAFDSSSKPPPVPKLDASYSSSLENSTSLNSSSKNSVTEYSSANTLKTHGQFEKDDSPAKTVTIGRKKGKTLPSSLNTTSLSHPHSSQSYSSNPKHNISLPFSMQISKFLLHTNNNSDDQNDRNSRNEPGLGLGSGFTPLQSSSFPITREKKTPLSVTRTISLKYSQKYQRQGSEITTDQVRAPKSVTTVLKYYRKYLSEFEKEMEVYEYKHIYFIGNIHKKYGQDINNPQLNYGYDDEKGDYNVTQHDHLGYRYEIIRLVGRGSFGQVVQCLDHKTTQTVAIKLIRNKKRFHAQAITEVDILRRLVEWDPYDQYHTVQMTDYFYFRNHLCIAFEYLAVNLYEFIKSNHFRGFHLCLVKSIISQLLQSLTMLYQHKLIHCDLKPENIMLKHSEKTTIKIIDFGSSCFDSEKIYTYIQSRFYRSPEVILGLSYHMAIDMWSLGCIAAELFIGRPLFAGENEHQQLACMMETLGLPDRHLLEKCPRKKLFFDTNGNPKIISNSKGKKRLPCTKSLYQVLKCHDIVFVDFIERCLSWDPKKRMTPKEGLEHGWITGHNTLLGQCNHNDN